MKAKDLRTAGWVGAGLLALAAVAAWQGLGQGRKQLAAAPGGNSLLERAINFLQCPYCTHSPLTGPVREAELVCPACNARFPYESGILDMMPDGKTELQSLSQRIFQMPVTAVVYDGLRTTPVARLFTGHAFQQEADQLVRHLKVKDGKPLLDISCGPGNFTAVLARQLPHSLVFGLDISMAQLRRARRNLNLRGLQNVLLVRGDAERLPFRSGVFRHVSNCGGLRQLPYLKRAVAEVARVLRPGGHFAGLALAAGDERQRGPLQKLMLPTLAVHFVDMDYLGWLMNEFNLEGYEYERSRLIGYFRASKASSPQSQEE